MAPRTSPRREHARVRRVLGQNFLTDAATVRHLADLAGDARLIYEVGAGRGRITTELLRRAARVVTFETDAAMAGALPGHPRLAVRREDFLAADPPAGPFTVVGNIPYGLTSAVVDWCLRADSLERAVLLTQWEYARKRTGDYRRWTRLTILTWPDFAWELAGRVPRAAFRPAPRVDGGVLLLDRRRSPLVRPDLLPAYRRMVETGFTGAGGSLQASLQQVYGRRVHGAFRAARVAADVPVGLVWPEQWLTLFRLLRPS